MKKRYRIVSLIIAVLTVMTLFVSCKKNAEQETQGTTTTDTVAPPNNITVSEIAEYTLIRAENADQTVIDALNSLRKSVKDICGVDMKASTDWTEGEIPVDSKEILVGNTNRREAEGLKTRDFRIKREGNKIYILGGSSEAVETAVNYFVSHYLSAEGLAIPDGTDYLFEDKYFLENVYFGSVKIDRIKYYGTLLKKNDTVAQNNMLDAIKAAVGYEVEKVSSAAEANFIFDEVSTDKLSNGQWGVISENGKITVCSAYPYVCTM